MHGRRLETVVPTVQRETREVRLVVLDCLSDTLRWNPIDGVQRPNAYTRAFGPKRGDEFSVDIRNRRHTPHRLALFGGGEPRVLLSKMQQSAWQLLSSSGV